MIFDQIQNLLAGKPIDDEIKEAKTSGKIKDKTAAKTKAAATEPKDTKSKKEPKALKNETDE